MNLTSTHRTRTFVTLAAAGALLAAPAIGQANKPAGKGKSPNSASAKSCKKLNVGFTARGTLVSVTPDIPATADNEATVTLKLTSANRHARRSGEFVDQDNDKKGVQIKGSELTIPTSDAYVLKLNGYEGAETPSMGDKVKVVGKIALTKKRCAEAGMSTAERYGAVNVRRVTITDLPDPDA
jgi:hypothetical protein